MVPNLGAFPAISLSEAGEAGSTVPVEYRMKTCPLALVVSAVATPLASATPFTDALSPAVVLAGLNVTHTVPLARGLPLEPNTVKVTVTWLLAPRDPLRARGFGVKPREVIGEKQKASVLTTVEVARVGPFWALTTSQPEVGYEGGDV